MPLNKGKIWKTISFSKQYSIQYIYQLIEKNISVKKLYAEKLFSFLSIVILVTIISFSKQSMTLLSPMGANNRINKTSEFSNNETGYEVLGFAPFWTINKMKNVDFDALTSLAYFGITINEDGSFDKSDQGYITYKSDKAERLFGKARSHGVKILLTLVQMDNYKIRQILDSKTSQKRLINETVQEVKNKDLDGVNVDFEYGGNPGSEYRNKYSAFVENLTDEMHKVIPESKVTVSVYAASAKQPKMYDVKALSEASDGIFMMAYDFATTTSDNAIPTAPLFGHKEGKYWYDIASAIDDFLKLMPSNKLVMGVPYYGYNYLVNTPEVKAETLPYYTWKGRPKAQTYTDVVNNINQNSYKYKDGWDDYGKVGWRAYYDAATYTWRMIFLEDENSLSIKYDYAKKKNLKGVGIWALGFDNGKEELWQLLHEKFGSELAKSEPENFVSKI